MNVLDYSPRIVGSATHHDSEIAAYMDSDGLDAIALDYYVEQAQAERDPDKYLVFFYIGTSEYQSTVYAYSNDHALELWLRDNRDGEDPEAVKLDESERNY